MYVLVYNIDKMGEACTMQSEFAERRWSQYMEMVKSKPKSDSGNQKEEKHAESKQFKQGIVIGSISALISSVVLAVLTVLFQMLPNSRSAWTILKKTLMI